MFISILQISALFIASAACAVEGVNKIRSLSDKKKENEDGEKNASSTMEIGNDKK